MGIEQAQLTPEQAQQFPKGSIMVPAMQIPGFRVTRAHEHNALKNLLFISRGGVGDQVCAEPTIRYAIENFKDCTVSLAAYDGLAELFTHLKFKRVFDLREETPVWENYLTMETIVDVTRKDHNAHLSNEFFQHVSTNAVDFSALCALRAMLPIVAKEIKLKPPVPELGRPVWNGLSSDDSFKPIVVHAGRHWASKTFPRPWWEDVLGELISQGYTPVLVGADRKDTGVVNLGSMAECVDLVNKTTLRELIYLLQESRVVLTNDSSPLHIAASGKAWIGFIATIKHPDHITHWRNGKWAWRMQNHSRGNIWDVIDNNPGADNPDYPTVEACPPKVLRSWLPDPVEFARWAIDKYENPGV